VEALAEELAARSSDVRNSDRTQGISRVGLARMSLSDALALGPAVWDAVRSRADWSSPFMSWAWHHAWALSSSVEEVAASEALVDFGAGGAVQAILPVLLRRMPFHRVPVTALTWAIGDLGCPDHLDVLAMPEADLGVLVPVLAELPWHVFILSNLAPIAANERRLCEAMASRGWVVRRRPLWGCPYLELSNDWDRYLATLSPKRRQLLRRKERNLRRDHAMTITDYDGDRLDEGWRWLITLHERRWAGAGGGAFRQPSVVRLHRRFAADLAARGQLWLTTLDLDGAPAAAWYGFASGDTVYFYQCGREPRWDHESVGFVLIGAMIRRAIERGYRRFDFLRGADDYKRHFTKSQRMTEEIAIFRPGRGGGWLRALDALATLWAQLRALPRRGATAGAPGDA
jgi:CelD/BcsL family acetyltransferase involved in cellulose biosynthesis